MYKNLVLVFVSLLIFNWGCRQKNENTLSFEKEIFDDSILYHIKDKGSNVLKISILKSGELNYISNYPDSFQQVIGFHPESGIVQSKINLDSSNKIFGRAYYFYDSSGNLSGKYNFENDIKVGPAFKYHDSTGQIKSILHYNDYGELIFRKTYDINGKNIKTERLEDIDN